MRYVNASTVLPPRLLRAVQAYAGGELLYIPARDGAKTRWGSLSGAKLRYSQRNSEIRSRYLNGEPICALSESFCLSEDSIRKIVRPHAQRGGDTS